MEFADIESGEVGYILVIDKEMKCLAVEAVAVALGADDAGEKLTAPFLGGRAGVVALLHLDIFDQPFVRGEIICGAEGVVFQHESLVGSVEDVVEALFAELSDRRFEIKSVFLAYRGDLPENHRVLVFAER